MNERDKIAPGSNEESKATDPSAAAKESAKSSDVKQRAASHSSAGQSNPPAIPDYELLRRIGGGSYGDVWLARSATGAMRALKIVWRHTFEDDRPFQREFEGIQHFERLSREHPSQLALFHVGRGEGYFYYVMELADAVEPGATEVGSDVHIAPRRAADRPPYQPHTLRADLEKGRLPAARVLEIGLALTEALSHLHTNGLVHRDVKPSNVIFVNGRPKLADIGLVTDAGDTRSIVGTEGYLPPEGPGTPQADLFALGKVLYEATTGIDRRQLPQLPPDLRDWPDAKLVFELNEVILKACAADARQRYRSAQEMHDDLALLQRGQSVKERSVRQHHFRAVCRIGSVAAVVVLTAAGVAFLWQTITRYGASAVPTVNEDGKSGTRNPKARDAHELGMKALGRGTSEGFVKALGYFNEAIKVDPGFVAAHARLFETYLMSEDHDVTFIDDKTNKLNELSATLMKLAPANAETHAALAIVRFLNDWRWVEAESEFKHALKLDPNCRMALTYYGYFLTRQLRASEARTVLERALALDPTAPLITKFLGHCEFARRHYEQALPFYEHASELEPSYPSGHYWAGRVHFALTNYSQALVETEQYELKQNQDPEYTKYRYQQYRKALDRAGPQAYWTNRIESIEVESARTGGALLSYALAMRYARVGDKEQALVWLEEAFAKHDSMEHLLVDEVWDDYRHEQRFKDILNKVRLDPWQR